MKKKIEIEVEIPDGYEFVRYGIPNRGDEYINKGVVEVCSSVNWKIEYVIVRKIWNIRPTHYEKYYFIGVVPAVVGFHGDPKDVSLDYYYFVAEDICTESIHDKKRFESGNCFRTRRDAEAFLEKISKR